MKQSILFLVCFSFIISNFALSQVGWLNQSNYLPFTYQHSYNCVFALNSTTCFLVTGHLSIPSADSNNYCVFKTSNGGSNWIMISSGNYYYMKALQFIDANTGFAVGGYSHYYPTLEDNYGQIISKTTNGGLNWTKIWEYVAGGYSQITDIVGVSFVNANTGWVCSVIPSSTVSILKTINGGVNWIAQNPTAFFRKRAIQFIDAQTGWIAGDTGYINLTTNGGTNWINPARVTTNHLKSIFFIDAFTGWACGNGGTILKTTNAGYNWTVLSSGVTDTLGCVKFYNSNTGWVSGYNKILATTNGGNSWTIQYTGASNVLQSISFANALTGWVCGSRTVLATVTGGSKVNRLGSIVPDDYKLEQNYPNPFNPETKIRFDVKKEFRSQESEVKLVIYDILGKEISTLINEALQSGSYEVTFDGSNLTSGIYFYRLTAGDYVTTKKMMMIK
jgi:photosystem II stability/assembly factor-like uncharacterized protein